MNALKALNAAAFTELDHETWRKLYARQAKCRSDLAHPLFVDGLVQLGIGPDRIPDLAAVNRKLMNLTGWRGVPVAGLEGPVTFFGALSRREFPIGNFIRDAADLNYTPAPDVFHDLYGHMPFFADPAYARFCELFGKLALAVADQSAKLRECERVFWFGVEFPLVKTKAGRRIFGGGILSSYSESIYSMSEEPEVLPFDLAMVRGQEFRIDEIQKRLFELESPEQLYASVESLSSLLLH